MAFEAGTGRHFGMAGYGRQPWPAAARTLSGMPPATPFVAALTIIAVLLVIVVSPTMLLQVGFNYGSEGGGTLEKFHPSTFVLIAAFGLYAVFFGNPVSFLDRIAATHRLVVIYLIGLAILLVQVIFVQRAAFSPVVDTFLPPALFLVMVEALHARTRRRLALFLHVFFLANALLGYYEFLTGHILLPPIGGALEELTYDWRAAALLGHPLTNANLTGAYLLMLLFGGARGLSPLVAALLFAVNFGAMFAFGGRAALALLVVVLALRAVYGFGTTAAGRGFDLRHAIIAAIAIPAAAAAVVIAADAGFFAKFLDRVVEDNGSATTRLAMFDVFAALPLQEILFGPDQELVTTRLHIEGLEYGIESFEVAFVLTYGLVPSLLFFGGLAVFSAAVLARTTRGAIVPLVYFFAVASTSVSLSSKSGLLSIIVLMLLILMERPDTVAPATSQALRRPA